ncbi:MAG: hypothetical protein RMI91_14600 [Gemmatales bacterium]|nr:hypothetical protein [Gemmatales bacterium]MDW7995875.1 hypothetical protein [Gemmatales bacterium]MDW8221533.1 hypothetical protein [Gemmatales bacterium]
MPYDITCRLWPQDNEAFFRDKTFRVIRQHGPHCVATVLAMLTGDSPDKFMEKINTQDPVSWSEALREAGMKLAYCPTDIRKLKHYMAELVAYDDLFTLSYYTTTEPEKLLGEPDERGWLVGSHIVILHRQMILDPATGEAGDAFQHECNEYHTKRIFRVVPVDHPRGL